MSDRERKLNYHVHAAIDYLEGRGSYENLAADDSNTLALAALKKALDPAKDAKP